MSAKSLVETSIEENEIVVFSKSYCPYCKATKSLLSEVAGAKSVKIYELDEPITVDGNSYEGSEIQSYLRSKTGQGTVPNVFIRKEHIGGNSDLQAAYQSGKLKKLLA